VVEFENSMSLPAVSRRNLLTGMTATPLFPVAYRFPPQPPGVPDPILPLWYDRQRLCARATALCYRWQKMETHLFRTIGFPQVLIPSPDGRDGICAQSHAEIDHALADTPDAPMIGASLHAELAAHQARWDVEAERLGFAEAKRQEDEAWDREAEASRKIFRTRATTLAGIQIKIALMAQFCTAGSDDSDFPLPQLRSTLADVKRLRRAFDAVGC
jgi:hypothetical protein